jgi:hypothetical protein
MKRDDQRDDDELRLVVVQDELKAAAVTTRGSREYMRRNSREFFRWRLLEEHCVGSEGVESVVLLRVYDNVNAMRPDWRWHIVRTDTVQREDGTVDSVPVYTGCLDKDTAQLQFLDVEKFALLLIDVQDRLRQAQAEWDAAPRKPRVKKVKRIALHERRERKEEPPAAGEKGLRHTPLKGLDKIRVTSPPRDPAQKSDFWHALVRALSRK